MFGASILVFRETLEAALIIGIIAAATRGVARREWWLVGGVGLGLVGAMVVAALAGRIGDMADGLGREFFNVLVLAIAIAMLAWHNIWMSRHGREMAKEAKKMGREVSEGTASLSALMVAISLAVLREGSEVVLFMQGLMADSGNSSATLMVGGVLGLLGGAVAGVILYVGFVRIPIAWFFTATSGLILLLAAAMASQMARQLVQADVLPGLASPLWDLSHWLPNDSAFGTVLHALVGYDAAPAGMQVLFYAAVAALIYAGMRWAQRPVPQLSS
jgi:high-affinity iron transporter